MLMSYNYEIAPDGRAVFNEPRKSAIRRQRRFLELADLLTQRYERFIRSQREQDERHAIITGRYMLQFCDDAQDRANWQGILADMFPSESFA